MKNALIGGLAAILIAGSSCAITKRQYIPGNAHEVQYERTTEKDFSKYKLEDNCLFNNCYNFWYSTPKADELNFNISKVEENINVLKFDEGVTILSKKYTPKKVSDKIDVMNCVTKASMDKLGGRFKDKEYFGYSIDILDGDLELKLPEINVGGIPYIVLRVEDVSDEETVGRLPIYLIPKKKGTKIIIPNQSFMHDDYEAQATIEGDVYQPFLNTPNPETPTSKKDNPNISFTPFPTSEPSKQKQEEWQGNTQKTPYMRYTEEQKKQNPQQQINQTNPLEEKATQNTINENEEYYTVKKGDDAWNIADRLYGSRKEVAEIQELNPLTDLTKLKVGQKIRVR